MLCIFREYYMQMHIKTGSSIRVHEQRKLATIDFYYQTMKTVTAMSLNIYIDLLFFNLHVFYL